MTRRATVVLSGGGAKAAAHLGALEVLSHRGIIPHRLIGTSMGAVVATGLAAGLSIDEVRSRLGEVERSDVAALDRKALFLGVFAEALLKGDRLRETLARLLPVQRFADLKLPLTVTAADLDTGELVCFGEGGDDRVPLADALYASCALPVLYPPARIGGRRLGDGGLREVVALEVAARFATDLVVAIDVGPGTDARGSGEDRRTPALVRAHNDAQFVLMASNTRLAVELWRRTPGRPRLLYVRPAVARGDTFATDRVADYVEAGRLAARAALDAVELDRSAL